jgi:hypothetical protein
VRRPVYAERGREGKCCEDQQHGDESLHGTPIAVRSR